MAKKDKNRLFQSLSFLFPHLVIRQHHLSKKDVRRIKENLLVSFSLVYLIVAVILMVLMISLSVFMMINSKYRYVEVYGLTSLVGQITLTLGSLLTIILIIIARNSQKAKISVILSRIAGDFLYLVTAFYMLCCIFADAQMGFTSNSETLSAAIIFVAVLVLIQPVYWRDALIGDIGTFIAIVVIAYICKVNFEMGAIQYYALIAIMFPFAGFLIISLLFYAESQRYKEILENERLHNRAYYDHLTRCKNRHALSQFLSENKNRWENNDNANLLMVLFDIDDFKLYNDQFSHLGGDYVLRSICDAIREEFPSPNLDFFRYGGEEFLLFFELRNPDDAPLIMQKIKHAISNLEIVAPNGAPKKMVTISLGGLLIKQVGDFEFENQMKTVDEYLYKAKASGKDVACFNGDLIN